MDLDQRETVNKIRNWILSNIDWPCEVHTKFLDSNLGCEKNVAESVSWMFEKEDYGIILEDDCVAHTSFFYFCEEMLNKYKDKKKYG